MSPVADWYEFGSAFPRGVGLVRDGLDLPSHRRLRSLLAAPGSAASEWPGSTWELVDGSFADLQPSSAAGVPFSDSLRSLVDAHADPRSIEWLPVSIVSRDSGEKRSYWVPSLLEQADYLGPSMRHDRPLFAVEFSPEVAGPYDFLAEWRGGDELWLRAHRRFRTAVVEAGCGFGIKWRAGHSFPSPRPSSRNSLVGLPIAVLDDLTKGCVLSETLGPEGRVELRASSEITTSWVPVEHVDTDEWTEVEVTTLSGAEFFIVWVPATQMFGSFDEDHSELVLFPEATWPDIRKRFDEYALTIWGDSKDIPCHRLDPQQDASPGP